MDDSEMLVPEKGSKKIRALHIVKSPKTRKKESAMPEPEKKIEVVPNTPSDLSSKVEGHLVADIMDGGIKAAKFGGKVVVTLGALYLGNRFIVQPIIRLAKGNPDEAISGLINGD